MKGMAVQRFVGTPERDTFGARLMALRTHLGMTREQFADETGLDKEQIRRFETKGQLATKNEFPSCDSVARHFGVQPAWLYSGSMVPRRLWPEWWAP